MEAGCAGAVSLERPRPAAARAGNEYVEAPLRPRAAERHPAALHAVVPSRRPPNLDNNNKKLPPISPCLVGEGSVTKSGEKVITGQPTTLGVDCSIICRECQRCRCESCRAPRAPPSAWLCSDFCLCSVDTAVDYASCLCCVKAALYHCAEEGAAEAPCGCGPPKPLARWACLALAAIPLPCLLCYWPFRGVAAAATRVYSMCSAPGCRCPPAPPLLQVDPRSP